MVRGTADAIYQNLYLLERSGASKVVVLSGDHIYRMDYAEMIRFHSNAAAEVTVACMEVSRDDAKSFGVMSVDADQRVTDFAEKPANPTAIPGKPDRSLASMGIYIFNCDTLIKALRTITQIRSHRTTLEMIFCQS